MLGRFGQTPNIFMKIDILVGSGPQNELFFLGGGGGGGGWLPDLNTQVSDVFVIYQPC